MCALPKVTVVLPVLNGAAHIADQLDALEGQDYTDWELLIVDNGSTDDSVSIVEQYRRRVPRLQIVTEPRRGRHHACNAGIAAAGGSALVFVDADDVVGPGYIAAMADALREHSAAVARVDMTLLNTTQRSNAQPPGLLMEGFGFLPFAGGGVFGCRADVLNDVGGFRAEAKFCEDVDLSWRLQLAGYDIASAHSAVMHVRDRATLRQTFRQHYRYGIARVWLYRTYRDRGMPRRSTRDIARDWSMILKSIPYVRTASVRERWLRRSARAVGFVSGSVRYRVLYI